MTRVCSLSISNAHWIFLTIRNQTIVISCGTVEKTQIVFQSGRNVEHFGGDKLMQWCRNRGGGQGGQCSGPPLFVRSVNPIRTGEDRLSPTITTGTPKVFHLPASLILSVKLTGVLNIFSALHCYPIGYIKSLHRYTYFSSIYRLLKLAIFVVNWRVSRVQGK